MNLQDFKLYKCEDVQLSFPKSNICKLLLHQRPSMSSLHLCMKIGELPSFSWSIRSWMMTRYSHLLGTDFLPSPVLSMLFIATTWLLCRHCYSPHFIDDTFETDPGSHTQPLSGRARARHLSDSKSWPLKSKTSIRCVSESSAGSLTKNGVSWVLLRWIESESWLLSQSVLMQVVLRPHLEKPCCRL